MNDSKLETGNGKTRPLFTLGCAIYLKNDAAVPGPRVVGEGNLEQGHLFPEGEFDEGTADGITGFVMQQLRAGERKFRVETSGECASATGVAFGLSLLFDTGEHFEPGPIGGMVHNYLQCAYDRWRGRNWRTKREVLGPAGLGID